MPTPGEDAVLGCPQHLLMEALMENIRTRFILVISQTGWQGTEWRLEACKGRN